MPRFVFLGEVFKIEVPKSTLDSDELEELISGPPALVINPDQYPALLIKWRPVGNARPETGIPILLGLFSKLVPKLNRVKEFAKAFTVKPYQFVPTFIMSNPTG